jgi:hypothetical protein
LIRHAPRDHLKKLEKLASEEGDRMGYAKLPQAVGEADLWEAEAAWPAE